MHLSYFKSLNNLKFLVSLSNNLSSLTFSFNFFCLFIFSFADNPYSLSLSKFLKISHFSIKVIKSTFIFSEILLISSSSIFNFLFV